MAKAKSAAKPKAKSKPGVFDAIEPLPADAWGLSRVNPGFASSEQAAALLGLGYPHMMVPSTAPFEGDHKALVKLQGLRVIPRAALAPLYELHTKRTPTSVASEAEPVLRYGGAYAVYFLDAMFGSEPTARAFVDQLAAYPVSEWSDDNKLENYGWSMIRMLAFTLWRVPAKVRGELRARLEEIFQRVSHGKPRDEWWRPVQALDVILHGREGVVRSANGFNGELHLSEHVYADDDPAWAATQVIGRLAKIRPADRAKFDIQLAVIGGPKVLAALRASPKKFKADQKKSIEVQLSLCA